VNVLVSESAKEMAGRIEALSADSEFRRAIEHNAREAALRYGWAEIAAAQSALYESLIAGRSPRAGSRA
jgi:glycosyltransferase involved in cell wall biosynthesis